MEAEKYITDFNFKIIDIVEGTNYRSDNIRTGANSVKASIRKVFSVFVILIRVVLMLEIFFR